MYMYFARCVLNTLFQWSLDVVTSAVLVVNSPGWLIRLPPAVIWMRFGSSFGGQKSTTMFAYIANLSGGMFLASSGAITNMGWCRPCPSYCSLDTSIQNLFRRLFAMFPYSQDLSSVFYSLISSPRSQDGPLASPSVRGSWAGRVAVVIL
jgi:hypothetical protein